MLDDPPFKKRLAILRAANDKLSIESAAERVRVEAKTWGNWEKAKEAEGTAPNALHIATICTEFKVSADWLLGRVDHETGLQPGAFIIDYDLVEQPPGPDEEGTWFVRVPRNPRVVEYEEMKRLEKDLKERRQRAAQGE